MLFHHHLLLGLPQRLSTEFLPFLLIALQATLFPGPHSRPLFLRLSLSFSHPCQPVRTQAVRSHSLRQKPIQSHVDLQPPSKFQVHRTVWLPCGTSSTPLVRPLLRDCQYTNPLPPQSTPFSGILPVSVLLYTCLLVRTNPFELFMQWLSVIGLTSFYSNTRILSFRCRPYLSTTLRSPRCMWERLAPRFRI